MSWQTEMAVAAVAAIVTALTTAAYAMSGSLHGAFMPYFLLIPMGIGIVVNIARAWLQRLIRGLRR